MEELGPLEEWLENEKKLRPLLEQMRPLLEKRLELEGANPLLAALRNPKELLPTEAPSSSTSSLPPLDRRPATMLLDNRLPLLGEPARPVPTMEDYKRLVDKRKRANRKKHEKEKRKKAADRKVAAKEASEDMEEEPRKN